MVISRDQSGQPILQGTERHSVGSISAPAAQLRLSELPVTLQSATTIRRRGPSLSRRVVQKGNVFQHSRQWESAGKAYGRFWIDVPGSRRQRRTIALGVAHSIARQKLREYIETTGLNSKRSFTSNTAPATTLRAQAAIWIEAVSTRRRKPVKPATISGWQHSLKKWVLPHLGDLLLADVGNAALKLLVETMVCAGLSPQTIVTHSKVVKMVVASAVDAEGEQIYPRKWNHNFIGLPIVDPNKQHRPTVTEAELGEILASAKAKYAVLFALLAGTGLRIGEALGLKSTDLSPECRVLYVRRSIWNGQEQEPKTPAALREIDIPGPLSRVLQEYVVCKSGYLFATKGGRSLQQRNVRRALRRHEQKVGFHAFRRFRTETLRRARVPEDLIRLWLGHSKSSVTDFYAGGLSKDLAWRREWCDRVGLGFSFGLHGLQNAVKTDSERAA